MNQDIRWKQRFSNFEKAIHLMLELRTLDVANLSQLEKEGVIQRFEFTLELAWKTLKDKMEYDGLILEYISPKVVVKEAFQAKYIDQIEPWLKMIEDRNILSHKYDFAIVEEIIPTIVTEYCSTLEALYKQLLKQL